MFGNFIIRELQKVNQIKIIQCFIISVYQHITELYTPVGVGLLKKKDWWEIIDRPLHALPGAAAPIP